MSEQSAREAVSFLRDLAHSLALTSSEDYEGWYPTIVALYGSGMAQDIILFIKGIYVLQQQLSGLIETLNSYYGAATSALQKGAQTIAGSNPGNAVNPGDSAAEQKAIECAQQGGFMLFGQCIKL